MILPDLAAAAAILILLVSLFVGRGTEVLLNDSDVGWHIVTGERIAATGALPRRDAFSFSRPGGDWYAWEWLSDLALGVAHSFAGLRGVVFLAAMTLAACAWTWCRLSRRMGADPLLSGLVAGLAIAASKVHWLARPHVLGWLLLLCWIWRMETIPERLRARLVLEASLFVFLWTNLHGSFFLAFPIAGAYAISYWFGDRRRATSVIVLMGCGVLATFINPYGVHLHTHLVHYLADTELQSRTLEFQSFNFGAPGSWPIIAVFLIAMAGAVTAVQQSRWAWALVLLMLLVIAFRSARGIPLLALAGLPMAAAALTVVLRPVRWLKGFFSESAAFAAFDRRANGLTLMLVAVVFAWWRLGSPSAVAATGFSPTRYPTHTDECVERLPADARLYSPDYLGGYLIYRFRGTRKVFADGRGDYYGAEFAKEYLKIKAVEPGWRNLYRRYHFSHALVPVEAPLLDALQREGWNELCRDRATVLLSRGDAQGP